MTSASIAADNVIDPATQYTKAQILLALALYAYTPGTIDPEENAHSKAAFEALMKLARTAGPASAAQADILHAEHLGLIPKATHVDDQGQPVFSAEQLAAQVGGTVEDVRRFVEETGLRESDLYSGPVHPLQ